MTIAPAQARPNYLRIALQSGLAAALCLGLPAGLLFWLILGNEASHSPVAEHMIVILQDNGLYSIYIVVIGSLLWSFLLGKISGYRRWWWIQLASALAILAAWFSPLANLDGILFNLYPTIPIHLNYASAMVGLVGSVTLFVGLAYGIVLRSARAALTIGLTTSLASVLAVLLTIFVFDQFGIRVHTSETDFAMSKVTAALMLTSAIAGGAVLGVGFNRFST